MFAREIVIYIHIDMAMVSVRSKGHQGVNGAGRDRYTLI